MLPLTPFHSLNPVLCGGHRGTWCGPQGPRPRAVVAVVAAATCGMYGEGAGRGRATRAVPAVPGAVGGGASEAVGEAPPEVLAVGSPPRLLAAALVSRWRLLPCVWSQPRLGTPVALGGGGRWCPAPWFLPAMPLQETQSTAWGGLVCPSRGAGSARAPSARGRRVGPASPGAAAHALGFAASHQQALPCSDGLAARGIVSPETLGDGAGSPAFRAPCLPSGPLHPARRPVCSYVRETPRTPRPWLSRDGGCQRSHQSPAGRSWWGWGLSCGVPECLGGR